MRAHLTNIHWAVREGFDITNLPREAIVPLKGEYEDEYEFINEVEDFMINTHGFRPQGFTWEIIEGTIH